MVYVTVIRVSVQDIKMTLLHYSWFERKGGSQIQRFEYDKKQSEYSKSTRRQRTFKELEKEIRGLVDTLLFAGYMGILSNGTKSLGTVLVKDAYFNL